MEEIIAAISSIKIYCFVREQSYILYNQDKLINILSYERVIIIWVEEGLLVNYG